MLDYTTLPLPTFELPAPDILLPRNAPEPFQVQSVELVFPNIPLSFDEIPQWRIAVIESVGSKIKSPLFHYFSSQIDDDRQRLLRYPLIHFRTNEGRASIWAIGEGANALREWLAFIPVQFQIGKKRYHSELTRVSLFQNELKEYSTPRHYRLHKYLPYQGKDYQSLLQIKTPEARIDKLESIIKSDLTLMANTLQWGLKESVNVKLDVSGTNLEYYNQKTGEVGLEITFVTRLKLPVGASFGLKTTLGYGVCTPATLDFL